jgi:hypothetical protein
MIGSRSDEGSPSSRLAEVGVAVGESTTDDDGCTMTSGRPPVEAGVFSIPGGFEVDAVEVGCTMTSGMSPDDAGTLSTTDDDG